MEKLNDAMHCQASTREKKAQKRLVSTCTTHAKLVLYAPLCVCMKNKIFIFLNLINYTKIIIVYKLKAVEDKAEFACHSKNGVPFSVSHPQIFFFLSFVRSFELWSDCQKMTRAHIKYHSHWEIEMRVKKWF